MDCNSVSSVDTTYDSDIETSSDWSSQEGSSSDLDISNCFLLSNPLSRKQELPLTENEKNLIDEFCQKVEEVGKQDNQAYNHNKNEGYTKL